MIFTGRGILLDIEGTTSSIRFVYDVMFPYVRRELDSFLNANWGTKDVQDTCQLIAADAGYESLDVWVGKNAKEEDIRKIVRKEIVRLMDGDVKATGLKQLQGLIWKAGFNSGEMKAHLYDDVLPAIKKWHNAGIDIRIYSSGSAAAQKLFFGHTIQGDILHYFCGHYDTTIGGKKEADSYRKITHEFKCKSSEILFISDVVEELSAAKAAGMETALSIRPDNNPQPEHSFPSITSFEQIKL